MKLALIRRQYSSTGGAELYVQRLLGALAGAGHEVHLFAEKWHGQAEGVQFHTVSAQGTRADRALRFAETVHGMLHPLRFDCVFSLERTVRQDVYRAGDGLHRVWLERRGQFAPFWKRPFVGMGAFHRNMLALEAQAFDPACTRHVIVNSEMVREEVARHFPAFPQERVHLVRNGVEVRRFQHAKRDAARKRFKLKDGDFVMLFVGSGWERKGLPWLLQFMRERQNDPTLKLLVVTRDRMRGDVPPNVILAGAMPDVEQAYAAADLLTFLPIYEPCSNVVSEALATGIPVVTTIHNGAAELIEAGINGHVLHDPRDLEELAKAVDHWRAGTHKLPVPTLPPLDLEVNVEETLRVLELAAQSRE